MQMTVSEGLPLNSKYIKMGREVMRGEGGGGGGGGGGAGGGGSSRWSECRSTKGQATLL